MKKIKKIIAIVTISYIAFPFSRITYAESASKSVGILIKVVPAVTSSEGKKVIDVNEEAKEETTGNSAQTDSSTNYTNTSTTSAE